jgi:hypothetical protein
MTTLLLVDRRTFRRVVALLDFIDEAVAAIEDQAPDTVEKFDMLAQLEARRNAIKLLSTYEN